MPNIMTKANEPTPMTTTAMAQSGIPPTWSSSTEGAETSLGSTAKRNQKVSVSESGKWRAELITDKVGVVGIDHVTTESGLALRIL